MIKNSVTHLKKVPLFANTADDELITIVEKMVAVGFSKGQAIINEGDPGNYLYVINEGRVRVVTNIEPNDEEIILSYLNDGDYFGEMSLITGEPRSATVIAETDVELYQLSKNDFDSMILKNPSISLSLTHVLTQRLQMANRSRENTERYYKSRITPHGTLSDTDIIKLLKFAEDNSLTGRLTLKSSKKQAIFVYKKGQLEYIDFEKKNEGEAMDEILSWKDGEFIIEPSIFKFSNATELEINEDSKENLTFPQIISAYLHEKFNEFIQIAGSRSTQSALNKTYHKFQNYFDILDEIQIRTSPELEVEISMIDSWTDKHVLFSAVILRDVVNTISKDLVGVKFWNIETANLTINEKLRELQFFDYFNQASDLVKD